jgi:hypothetical protein
MSVVATSHLDSTNRTATVTTMFLKNVVFQSMIPMRIHTNTAMMPGATSPPIAWTKITATTELMRDAVTHSTSTLVILAMERKKKKSSPVKETVIFLVNVGLIWLTNVQLHGTRFTGAALIPTLAGMMEQTCPQEIVVLVCNSTMRMIVKVTLICPPTLAESDATQSVNASNSTAVAHTVYALTLNSTSLTIALTVLAA